MPAEICDKCLGTGKVLDPVQVGAAYKAKRVRLGISLTKVAQAMDIDTATLCRLEQGGRSWSSYYAIRFEQALNILRKCKSPFKEAR